MFKPLRIATCFIYFLFGFFAIVLTAEVANAENIAQPTADFTGCDDVTTIPLTECDALIAFLTAVGYPESLMIGNNPCVWAYHGCDAGSVSDLLLGGLSTLDGFFSPEVTNLTNLRTLSLSNNNVTGNIPTDIGNLTQLTSFAVGNNDLTGTIPTSIGNLTQLTYLDLSLNELTGSLPAEIGNYPDLEILNIHRTSLTGPLPPEIGNLTSLVMFQMYDTGINGEIPPEFGNLINLEEFWAQDSQLQGTFPPEFGNLASLDTVYVNRTPMNGLLPTELSNLGNAFFFVITDTGLCGDPADSALQAWWDATLFANPSDLPDCPPTSINLSGMSANHASNLMVISMMVLLTLGTCCVVLTEKEH